MKIFKTSKLMNFILIIFTIYFCCLPILGVIIYGINGDSTPIKIIDIIRIMKLLANSIALACAVTIVSVIIGTIAAFTLYRINFRGRKLIRILMLLPLVNPAFVGSISFIMLFGKRGLITHDLLGLNVSPFGWQGVFFLQIVGSVTLAYLIISASIYNTDVDLEDAARNLGAKEATVFFKVTLPMMKPEIYAAGLMIFLRSMSDFTTPLIIGGNFRTLATELYVQITGLYNLRLASISAIILLLPCVAAFFYHRKIVKNKRYTNSGNSLKIEYDYINPWLKYFLITFLIIVQLLFVSNILFVVIGAFTKNWGSDFSFTLSHVKEAFGTNTRDFLKPMFNSIFLSLFAGVVSSLLGITIAYKIKHEKIQFKTFLDIFATLPAAVPGILFGIGYLVTFKYPIFGIGKFILPKAAPIILLGSNIIVYLICIARNINIPMKNCFASLAHMDPDIENAAINLGASERQTYKLITIPLLQDAFFNSLIKVFSSTMTSLGAIIFLIMPKNKVIIQIIFQKMTGGLSLGVPAVLAISLSVITLSFIIALKLLSSFMQKGRWKS